MNPERRQRGSPLQHSWDPQHSWNPGKRPPLQQAYSLCGLAVKVDFQEPGQAEKVTNVWEQLFTLRKLESLALAPSIGFQFETARNMPDVAIRGELVFQMRELRAWKTARGFLLRCGASALDLDLPSSRGVGVLDDGFWDAPLQDQREFFLLGCSMLLCQSQRYGLHSGGVAKDGTGVLIVGESGSGKTTLTLGLLRDGWSCLSDDALMLQHIPGGIEALAFRRGFSCTPATTLQFPELAGFMVNVPGMREGKRIVDVESLYPTGFTLQCHPQLILFPRIVQQQNSQLVPLDETTAFTSMIQETMIIKNDQFSLSQHLEVLKLLAHQARGYQLLAGADVYQNPAAVSQLISEAMTAEAPRA